MPALTAANVTCTVTRVDRVERLKQNLVKVQFGDGALTYPSGGVPLPAAQSFGMRQSLIDLIPVDTDDAKGFLWKYDRDNNKLRAYRQGVTTGATAAAALANGAFPLNENGAEIAARLATSAASTSYDLGPFAECSTSFAPASHTLYFLARGK
jgi:hypothetical protein